MRDDGEVSRTLRRVDACARRESDPRPSPCDQLGIDVIACLVPFSEETLDLGFGGRGFDFRDERGALVRAAAVVA
ncbi:MAG: hypothetical protein M3N24_07875 [Actinomycetota bacterium]|nr:hypothetical protein [Actinomycetota bacterium]